MNVPKELLCQLLGQQALADSTISPLTCTLPSTLPVRASWVNSERNAWPAPNDGSRVDVGGVVVACRDDTSPGSGDDRFCAWCHCRLPIDKRRNAKTCSKKCRQASWRFKVGRADTQATDRPMRFAYADPPYPGKSHYYPESTEVDHVSLLDRLTRDYPDGWALSTSSRALRDILPLCPPGVRVCAWFKGPRPTKSRLALSSWEPVLVCGGRPLHVDVVCNVADGLIAQGRFRAFPGAMIGMKPPTFAEWMFRLLGASRGDELDDLFPGSGTITVAWARFTADSARLQPSSSPPDNRAESTSMNGTALAHFTVPTSLPSFVKCAISTPLSPVSPGFRPLFLFFSLRSKDEVRPSGVSHRYPTPVDSDE